MPAGLYQTVLASSAIAAPPAKALPMPDALFSAIWKNAAEAGADAATRTAIGAERRTNLRMLQGVAPVLLAGEAPGFAQRLEHEHHLAPVAAGERGHQRFD